MPDHPQPPAPPGAQSTSLALRTAAARNATPLRQLTSPLRPAWSDPAGGSALAGSEAMSWKGAMMHVPVWRSLSRRPRVCRRRRAASGAVLLSGTLLLALGAYGALQWPVSGGRSVAGAKQVSFGHGAGQGRVVRYTLTADE